MALVSYDVIKELQTLAKAYRDALPHAPQAAGQAQAADPRPAPVRQASPSYMAQFNPPV